MSKAHPIGRQSDSVPIPHVSDNTAYIAAGAITFGVEYRVLNNEIIEAHSASDPKVARAIRGARDELGIAGEVVSDEGVTIHVFATENMNEYLRFDAFWEDRHYHYINPGVHHIGVGFDEAANGDFLSWIFQVVGVRLPEMLALAGATDLAARIDIPAIQSAIPELRNAATMPAIGVEEDNESEHGVA